MNLWRMFYVYQGDYHKEIHHLHEKYGPVVCIGPNVFSLNYPELIKIIYNTKENYRKVGIGLVFNYCSYINLEQTEFYQVSSVKTKKGKTYEKTYNMFSRLDPKEHYEEQRLIWKYYKMANARNLEPSIDEVINHLCCQWEKHFICPMKTFDLAEWLSLCE